MQTIPRGAPKLIRTRRRWLELGAPRPATEALSVGQGQFIYVSPKDNIVIVEPSEDLNFEENMGEAIFAFRAEADAPTGHHRPEQRAVASSWRASANRPGSEQVPARIERTLYGVWYVPPARDASRPGG